MIEGFVAPSHPLSLRASLNRLSPMVRPLAAYEPESLWEQDTATLPKAARAYRKKLREFARTHLRPNALSGDAHEAGDAYQAVLAAAGRAGLLSDFLPAPLGSLPPSMLRVPITLSQSLKMEELCAECAGWGLMIGAHGLGAAPIVFSGDLGMVRRALLPAYRSNERGAPRIFAFGITEPTGGSDVEDSDGAATHKPYATAKRTSGGWLLNGRKVFISGGDIAHAVTVFAALENEGLASWTCFLVERGAPGFSVGRTELKMGQRASGAAELVFEDVFVPDAGVVGKLRAGWAINRAVLNSSRIPVGAIALGIARGALERALTFATTATLAGKRLIDYQDVQMSVAQMMIDVQAMRALVWQSATWRPTQAKASIAKVFCSDTAMRVCDAAMDLLGNHALAHGNYVEKHFRDARLTQIYEGTNQINRLAILEDQLEQIDA